MDYGFGKTYTLPGKFTALNGCVQYYTVEFTNVVVDEADVSATTAELNFPIGITNARGAVFLDSAICTDDYKKDRNILLGPGIGFRYLSDYGIFKLDIAYGIDHDEDDRQIKLHLSFGPEF